MKFRKFQLKLLLPLVWRELGDDAVTVVLVVVDFGGE